MELEHTIEDNTKAGQQIAKEENAVTKQLDELIQNEYEAMSFMQEIKNDPSANDEIHVVLEIVKQQLSGKEYLNAEMIIMDSFVTIEKLAFKQGFIRGIAAAIGEKA